MSLPLLVSVPHAGLEIPDFVRDRCRLTREDVIADGDEQAREIYELEKHVARYVTSEIARAIVDLNRPEDDRGRDGVVKTHTVQDVPIWSSPLAADEIERLLADWHRPFHDELRAASRAGGVRLGVDCHTMLAVGPEIGPGAGIERPAVCLSDHGGNTCPRDWTEAMAECFRAQTEGVVSIDDPFRGGHIVRTHSAELPWMQIELSRSAFASVGGKRDVVLRALTAWCDHL